MATLTRYEPIRGLLPLNEAINQLFSDSYAMPRFAGRAQGPVANSNLFETKEGYIFQVALPGVSSDAVEITVQEDRLSIKAKSSITAPEGGRMLWSNLGATEFTHRFSLPTPVNAENAQAEFTNGILTLTLPKAEHVKVRTIKVNGTNGSTQA